MKTKIQELYKSIRSLYYLDLDRPRAIKVTYNFYNYLSAVHKENIYLTNNHGNIVSYFMGIAIVIDDTIDDYYKLEY